MALEAFLKFVRRLWRTLVHLLAPAVVAVPSSFAWRTGFRHLLGLVLAMAAAMLVDEAVTTDFLTEISSLSTSSRMCAVKLVILLIFSITSAGSPVAIMVKSST